MKNKCKISIKMVVPQPGFGGQHGPDYPRWGSYQQKGMFAEVL